MTRIEHPIIDVSIRLFVDVVELDMELYVELEVDMDVDMYVEGRDRRVIWIY
jgi:hypothetical protein